VFTFAMVTGKQGVRLARVFCPAMGFFTNHMSLAALASVEWIILKDLVKRSAAVILDGESSGVLLIRSMNSFSYGRLAIWVGLLDWYCRHRDVSCNSGEIIWRSGSRERYSSEMI